jgi:amino acid transporter
VSADPWGERLPRALGLFSTIAVSVGISIGSGIFRVPASVAAVLPDAGSVLLCWIAGGFIVLCGTLSIAELAAAVPRSGGVFAYLLEAFGPLPAFLFGWAELTVVRAAALGAIATVFAEYLGYFIPLSGAQVRLVAALAIVLIGLLNYLGVRGAAAVLGATTSAKYLALLALGILAYTASGGTSAHFTPLFSGSPSWSLLASALVPVMWTYDGWADPAMIGGEMRQPGRTLPLGLILGALAVLLVYLVVNLGFLYALALPQMAGSKLIAASVAQQIPLLGGAGTRVIAAVVVLATFSSLNGSMLIGSRIFFAMGDRRVLFRALARVSPRFNTPSLGILLATVLGVAYVLANDFAELADKFVLGVWPFYALAVAGVFVLRRSRPDMPRPYRVWGYPLVPLLFLAGAAGLIVNALLTKPRDTGVTFLIILAGVPVYLARRRWFSR